MKNLFTILLIVFSFLRLDAQWKVELNIMENIKKVDCWGEDNVIIADVQDLTTTDNCLESFTKLNMEDRLIFDVSFKNDSILYLAYQNLEQSLVYLSEFDLNSEEENVVSIIDYDQGKPMTFANINESKIILGGFGRTCFLSSDNGENWHDVIIRTAYPVRDIYWDGLFTLVFVSGFFEEGLLGVSENYGQTWKLTEFSNFLYDLEYDGEDMYLGGDKGLVFHSTNHGTSFDTIFMPDRDMECRIVEANSEGLRVLGGHDGEANIYEVLGDQIKLQFQDTVGKITSYGSSYGKLQVAGTDQGNLIYNKGEVSSTSNTTSQNLRLYPNPTKGIFNIENAKNISRIQVLDLFGRVVFEQKGGAFDVDISGLPSGTYFALIQTDGEDVLIEKVIKI